MTHAVAFAVASAVVSAVASAVVSVEVLVVAHAAVPQAACRTEEAVD